MLNHMKIGTKLTITFLAIILIFIIVSIIILFESRQALLNASFNQLESARADKKARLEDFFTERESDMHVLLEMIIALRQNAFQKLQAVREHKKSLIEEFFKERLHDIKIKAQTPSISQALERFEHAFHIEDEAARATTWQSLEEQFDLELKKFKEEHNYHDLFIIAKDGDIVYSIEHGSQMIGQNILTGELKNTPINSAFQKGLQEITLQDFAHFSDEEDEQHLALLTAPIYLSGQLIGVLMLCIQPDPINAIMQKRQGMGRTGESYLVGAFNDQISYRSNRTLNQSNQSFIGDLAQGADIDNALAGQANNEIQTDHTGTPQISSYAPLTLPGLNWAIITTMSLEEMLVCRQQNEQEDFFDKYVAQYGYYDLLLIRPNGNIFYTVKQESDYRTNILTGKYANTGLGHLVQEVLKNQTFSIGDYAPYPPSDNKPAAFIAQPLFHNDKIEVIVVLQIGDVAVNKVMQQRAGMGQTGEAYLVGSDKLMRSNSFLDPINRSINASFANPIKGSVNTKAVHAALAGETNIQIIEDYRGNSVLSAYTPFTVGNHTWALIVEISEAEAFAAIIQLEWLLGIISFIGIATIIGIAWWITRSIKHPLNRLVTISKAIAAGNLNNNITVTGRDEIGELLQAFADMQTQLSEHLETEINNVIHAISKGDFNERISLDNKTGFFQTISEGINQIVESNQKMIEETMRVFAALAQGDLTQTIEGNYTGDFEQLKNDANITVEKLTEIMLAIQQTSTLVTTAADELSRGNVSLSQRTEEQAASLEETAASMEQMTVTVQQNADNAKEATQLALRAKDQAEKGGEVVGAAIYAITEISNSSKRITDIISVIDEIAFQTNLLALNASVEAARAGEQGRGFAVVASEVRGLAQRSAAAAQEIKELIQDSVTKVEEGTKLANQSGTTLEEIVIAVKKVNDIVSEIAAASQEQSSGINQVNKAVTQMDEMTQQNAVLVEQAVAASDAMSTQTQTLKNKVAFFKFHEQQTHPFSEQQGHQDQNKPRVTQHPSSEQEFVTSTTKKYEPVPHSDDSDWEEF